MPPPSFLISAAKLSEEVKKSINRMILDTGTIRRGLQEMGEDVANVSAARIQSAHDLSALPALEVSRAC